jgi:nucleoside-diphosphate-sugar epimerase
MQSQSCAGNAHRTAFMKIVIPGGSGPVGGVLARVFRARGDDVVIHDATSSARSTS